MDLQHSTQSIGGLERVFDGKLEQAVDGDITLPEYCADILRILKCSIEPSVQTLQARGERVTLEGSARVQVLYAAEDGMLQCFEQSYPFTRTADIAGLSDDACLAATSKTEFANGRAVSQRRLDIHGMVSIHITVSRRRQEAVLTEVLGGGIQQLAGVVRCSSLEALQSVTFPLSEVLEIDPNAPPVDQIILRRTSIVPGEVKAIKNKLLIKGSLELRVAYLSRGQRDPVYISHSLPISQILEADGVHEGTTNALALRVCALEITHRADANGAARLLEINVRIAAEIKGYAPIELPVLRDAYSTQGGIALEHYSLETQQVLENFYEPFAVRESFDLPGGVRSIQLVQGELLPPEVSTHDEAAHVSGRVKYHVVYIDHDGQLANTDCELPYTYRRNMKHNSQRSGAEVEIELQHTLESIIDNALELRAELAARGELSAVQNSRVVQAIHPCEEEENLPRRAPLTIYFPGDGEPLWEIAKRYRTTMDAVRLENELESDTTTAGQMLLIPCI